VVAAAVILDAPGSAVLQGAGLTDSKKLSPRQRQRLDTLIRHQALAYGLGLASVGEIDRLNILQASLLAMGRAVAKLPWDPATLDLDSVICWVDGNQRIPGLPWPQQTWVGGDRQCLAIAAASVLAKVWRDGLMERLDGRYPGYGLGQHKGYGTAAHRSAIARLGPSPCHRRSFAPCREVTPP